MKSDTAQKRRNLMLSSIEDASKNAWYVSTTDSSHFHYYDTSANDGMCMVYDCDAFWTNKHTRFKFLKSRREPGLDAYNNLTDHTIKKVHSKRLLSFLHVMLQTQLT